MSIKINNLSKSFLSGSEEKSVLKDVNVEIGRGEIFTLFGKNGTGKTTLLKILSTLILPDSGEVLILGRNLVKEPEFARVKIGLVFDAEKSFYQLLNVEENLKFYARLFDIKGKTLPLRVGEVLEKFGLRDWSKTRLSHCSSGIKQKIAIARAFIHDPEIILIDELTRSLDASSKEEIIGVIKELVKDGNKTCLIVTHDRDLKETLRGRSGTLENGVIV